MLLRRCERIVGWPTRGRRRTLERSGILADGNNGFYYQTIDQAIKREGDLYKVIDVLARQVGILGVFSDWAAPVTYSANCMGIK